MPYTRLSNEVELEEAKPFPHVPDEVQRIIFQRAEINYGLLNKSWRTKYLIDQGNVGTRVTELPLLRVLFPQIRPSTARHLVELDTRVRHLYQVLATHEAFIQMVEDNLRVRPPTDDPTKALSYFYFRQHLSALAGILEKIPTDNSPFVEICIQTGKTLRLLVMLGGVIPLLISQTDITLAVFLSCLGLTVAICCIGARCETRLDRRYASLCRQLQSLLNRPLPEIQRNIRAIQPIEVVIE